MATHLRDDNSRGTLSFPGGVKPFIKDKRHVHEPWCLLFDSLDVRVCVLLEVVGGVPHLLGILGRFFMLPFILTIVARDVGAVFEIFAH